MSGPFGSQQWMYNASSGFYPYEINNSLKFEDGDNSYLSRTPTSASNRKTWTWSGWFKRGNITNDTHTIWRAYGTSGSTGDYIQLMSDDTLSLSSYSGGYQWRLRTSAVFRDTSSWYHIVVSIDTTQSTSSDRAKLYVNGEQTTAFSVETYPSSSYDTYTNTASAHYIGHRPDVTDQFDGYLAEINFIDGTALDASSFGETKEGIWVPKDPTGLTYGTNGFRLPFTETTTANGFNTVTYSGTGATQSIDGVGFQPDFIWIKERSSTSSHILSDTVRGATGAGAMKYLESDTTDAEGTASNIVTSFDTDGFTTGNSGATNQSGQTYVGWCWGGGTNDKTYTVTVVDDGGNKYRFDGHGTSSIALNLTEGATYTFNYPSAHPLRFSTTSDGTHGGGSEYTTGVTHVSDTQTTFTVPSGAPVLYYYCSIHSGMGGQVNTNTTDGPTHAEGTILSRVKPNADYGFSIVTWTGTGSAGTVAHGLGVAPNMIIIKNRNGSGANDQWYTWHSGLAGNNYFVELDTNQQGNPSSTLWDGPPTTTVFDVKTNHGVNGSSDGMLAYCFADVTGYQKIGSYSGTGSSGNSITGLGFKPAFLMIKRTDNIGNWWMLDSTRDGNTSYIESVLLADSNGAEFYTGTGWPSIEFTNDGFDINATAGGVNASGGTYIYLAIADTRDALFTSDASGNGNHWTPNALQHSDVMPDTPTDGFAVLNNLSNSSGGGTFSEGNLKFKSHSSGWESKVATIGISSGKWYFEGVTDSSGGHTVFGLSRNPDTYLGQYLGYYNNTWGYYLNNGKKYNNLTATAYGSTATAGDVIGIAFDADAGTLTFYKNNVSQGVAFSGLSPLGNQPDWFLGCSSRYYSGYTTTTVNFGQDSSFNGTKTPQGNTDANGKGDFYYAPPSGHLALCTANLPDPAIDPNKGDNPENYFNTVLYTGDGTTSNAITGVGFQPDFNWIKNRTTAVGHVLHDAVRGNNGSKYYYLNSISTAAETVSADDDALFSLDADGFTVGYTNGIAFNKPSDNYVAWNWLAGTSFTNSSGTNGATIASTGSVNTDAGFSIVSYSGNSTTGATVGHGLSSAPEMMIIKGRNVADNWFVYHHSIASDAETDKIQLNLSNAADDNASYWNDTAPTSNVFTLGNNSGVNSSSYNYIAYCFHSVEGYSKFSWYVGNGSSDGPFVYTGFRPAFVLIKSAAGTSQSWQIQDAAREPFNDGNRTVLFPDLNNAEVENAFPLDFLSNGFKLQNSGSGNNLSGATYIYMAFAEQPFKYSNAR